MAYLMQKPLALSTPRLGADLRQSVEQLLFYEAWCMDESRYDDWLAIWEPEMAYWVPIDHEDNNFQMVSIIHDNRPQAEQRVARLKSRLAFAQQPRSRMIRVISNIVILADDNDTVTATSTFTLGEFRGVAQEVYLGRNLHVLKKRDGQLRISEKKVSLLNSDDALGNLTFLV